MALRAWPKCEQKLHLESARGSANALHLDTRGAWLMTRRSQIAASQATHPRMIETWRCTYCSYNKSQMRPRGLEAGRGDNVFVCSVTTIRGCCSSIVSRCKSSSWAPAPGIAAPCPTKFGDPPAGWGLPFNPKSPTTQVLYATSCVVQCTSRSHNITGTWVRL